MTGRSLSYRTRKQAMGSVHWGSVSGAVILRLGYLRKKI